MDVLHVHFAHNPGAWVAPLIADIPIIVSTMGGDVLFDEQPGSTFGSRLLTRRLFRCADVITVKNKPLPPGKTFTRYVFAGIFHDVC